jgi:hypothetical protein
VEETATLAIQAHATTDQVFVVIQEERTLSGNNSDANRLHSPAVSTTAYCEDRDKCELTAFWLTVVETKLLLQGIFDSSRCPHLNVHRTVFHQSSSPVSPVPVKRRQP